MKAKYHLFFTVFTKTTEHISMKLGTSFLFGSTQPLRKGLKKYTLVRDPDS